MPTPGVAKAAGVPKNMSVDSEYTEETVLEEEVETPKKSKSFFRRVASTLTGESDGSSVSTHMKPPAKKYHHVETVTSDTEEETVSSTSL